eukprot:gene6049-6662_t
MSALLDSLTLRVRTQIGTWRVNKLSPSDTIESLRVRLRAEHHALLGKNCFSLDPAGNHMLDDDLTVHEAGLKNGDMLYAHVEEGKVGVHESSSARKVITKDGKIMHLDAETALKSSGFRPGMLPLRSMKMHWTLNEFMAMDEQFVYKVKAQDKPFCSLASVETTALGDFQTYCRKLDFHSIRLGYLYGRVEEGNKVVAEVVYEPPQETTDLIFTLLDDPKAAVVEGLASLLGLQKVGWVFSHPPREKSFHFSGPEVLFTAEQQLEAAQGVEETSFVTVKLTLDPETEKTIVEAFQVSKQCMEMVAEGVLQACTHPGHLSVSPTFTAMVEGKPAQEVDCSFFLVSTPIEQFQSTFLVNLFPRGNRLDHMQSREDIKRQFNRANKEGWSFVDMLGDFHLLLYLTDFLDLEQDMPRVIKAIVDRETPLDEGYTLLLRSIAGMD